MPTEETKPNNQAESKETKEQKTARIQPYMWKKGQSGNPKGRTAGKTMKEYARQLLECQTDEERQDFLHGLSKDIIWKMAEGLPEAKTDITSKGEKLFIQISKEIADKNDINTESDNNSQG